MNWNELFNGKKVLEKYEPFINICSELIETYASKVKTNTGKAKPKLLTKELTNQIFIKEKHEKDSGPEKYPLERKVTDRKGVNQVLWQS